MKVTVTDTFNTGFHSLNDTTPGILCINLFTMTCFGRILWPSSGTLLVLRKKFWRSKERKEELMFLAICIYEND